MISCFVSNELCSKHFNCKIVFSVFCVISLKRSEFLKEKVNSALFMGFYSLQLVCRSAPLATNESQKHGGTNEK